MIKQVLLLGFFLHVLLFGQAQSKIMFSLETAQTVNAEQVREINWKALRDTVQLMEILTGTLQVLQGKGYAESHYILHKISKDSFKAIVNPGPQYSWISLSKGSVDPFILSEIRFKEKSYQGDVFRYKDVESLLESILEFSGNNGYPFATVRLDSILISKGEVSATLNLDKNQLIKIDTLVLLGEAKVNPKYLSNYLEIKPGDLYNESLINEMMPKIRDLVFLEASDNPDIFFMRDQARINLYLKAIKSSRFDFIFGILPNSSQTGGKLLITGDANLYLVNPFGTGKTIAASWKNLQPRSPQIDLLFKYPYIFQAPLGIDASFNLFKKDTLYIDIRAKAGLQFILSGQNYFRAFIDAFNSNLLFVDTATIRQTMKLPAQLDVNQLLYGIEYHKEKLDYRISPKQGYDLTINLAAGNKKVKRNSKIIRLSDDQFDFNSLYDSLPQNALTIKTEAQVSKFWPLGRWFTLKTAYRGGLIYNDGLAENELFRIGGQKLLRGFDDESLFASMYQVFILEMRYLISRNSYFSAFVDGGYVEKRVYDQPTINWTPYGFGLGLAFETRAGVFGLSYALGHLDSDNPLLFKNAKIHFGYVSLF